MIRAANIRLKRAYAPASKDDGRRILVDRLWPRGLTKSKAAIDDWQRDVAPTEALRTWFNHDPARWRAFQRRYRAELRNQGESLRRLRSFAREAPITLVYAAHDEKHNNAAALRQILLSRH